MKRLLPLALLLASCGGGKPAPRPPAKPAALVVLCHVIEEETSWLSQRVETTEAEARKHVGKGHEHDYPGECRLDWQAPYWPGQPKPESKPEPEVEPKPEPQRVPLLEMTICHYYDREGDQDRGRKTMTLPRERAEWHLETHEPDTRGACPDREI